MFGRVLLFFLLFGFFETSEAARPKGQIIYSIFVRSFQDSNGDGIGDLKGITSRLDYLKDLGFTAIWLTPIVKSPSYHSYDAIDFKAVQKEYGTIEDYKALVKEAHLRNIKVISDIAVNHTSNQNPEFIESSRGKNSPFRNRYVWKPKDPGWKFDGKWTKLGDEFYYSRFSSTLPDWNWNDPGVLLEVKDLLHFWSSIGDDAYRLDAARYYVEGPNGEPDTPETHAMIKAFTGQIRKDFPGSYFVGEIWADSKTISAYVNSGDELDLAFAFPLAGGLVDSLKKNSLNSFQSALVDSLKHLKSMGSLAPFITNHDMRRVASQVGGDEQKLKLAADILLTLPGTPVIYYGEEIGMADESSAAIEVVSDKIQRRPMIWNNNPNFGFTNPKSSAWENFSNLPPDGSVEDQLANENSLLRHYKNRIAVRLSTQSLMDEDLQLLEVSDKNVLAYLRPGSSESTVLFANFSAGTLRNVVIVLPDSFSPKSSKVIWGAGAVKLEKLNGHLQLSVSSLKACESLLVQLFP